MMTGKQIDFAVYEVDKIKNNIGFRIRRRCEDEWAVPTRFLFFFIKMKTNWIKRATLECKLKERAKYLIREIYLSNRESKDVMVMINKFEEEMEELLNDSKTIKK